MSLEDRRNLDPCHCCEPSAPAAPAQIWNRPALPEVDYRVGSFTSFRRAIFDAIAHQAELREWTTRRSEDYGIAVTEMWAYLADILTFYQERAVNEAFLRTALHRDSVLRLSALLGYQINPGVAATADLAFTLDKGKSLQIPVGLRVQSVPGQGEKPQKFETVEAITAEARLNQVRIYSEPTGRDPLGSGSDWGVLGPWVAQHVRALLAPGDKLVMFLGDYWEDKDVVALEQIDWYSVLRWTPAVQGDPAHLSLDGANVRKYTRKFRLFGHNAPETQLTAISNRDSPTGVDWIVHSTGFFISHGVSVLELDGIYEDLKPGTPVLVTGSFVSTAGGWHTTHLSVIARIDQVTAKVFDLDYSREIMSDTVTVLTLAEPLPYGVDRRTVTVYQLQGPAIQLWRYFYDPTHPGLMAGSGEVHVPVDLAGAMEKDRSLIIDDASQRPQVVRILSRSFTGPGGVPHMKLAFTPELDRNLDSATAFLYGNVARATHGETVAGEVLGDGEASLDFQRFSLRKSPVTFVPSATAPRGGASTLEVRVDGVRWHEANALYGQPADARVYRTRIDDDSVMTVQFGDGRTGARLPSGRNNVVATYRQGLGVPGRVGARSLTRLLDRPVGLKAATNPAGAEGGADPEDLDEARRNAPNTVRTFDRIVSLRDFEDAAREFTGIAKARAAWVWEGSERMVQLTVAADAGVRLGRETKERLVAYLNHRRHPYRKMRVRDYEPRPVLVSANILSHPDHLPEDVQERVQTALLEFFTFERRDLGQGLHMSDLHQVLQEAEGVIAADIDALIYKPPGWTLLLLYGHTDPSLWSGWLEEVLPYYLAALRIRGLRFAGAWPEPAQPRLPVYPNELLSIQVPRTDLWVNVRRAAP